MVGPGSRWDVVELQRRKGDVPKFNVLELCGRGLPLLSHPRMRDVEETRSSHWDEFPATRTVALAPLPTPLGFVHISFFFICSRIGKAEIADGGRKPALVREQPHKTRPRSGLRHRRAGTGTSAFHTNCTPSRYTTQVLEATLFTITQHSVPPDAHLIHGELTWGDHIK